MLSQTLVLKGFLKRHGIRNHEIIRVTIMDCEGPYG